MADVHYCGFVWDSNKAEQNKKKHSVSFELAVRVFQDSSLYEMYDPQNSSLDEERYNVIGTVDGVLFLFVTTTDSDNEIRIISARIANNSERRLYFENI